MGFSNNLLCLATFDENRGIFKEACCLEELLKAIYFLKTSYGSIL